ncbi:MAG: phage major capsid protein [Elusimicrobiota bacterium]
MSRNDELIRKTVESSDFLNGGLLNPEQQTEFIKLVRQYSKMIPLVRQEHLTVPKKDIDKLHIGEPVTRKAEENVATGPTGKPVFNQIKIETEKVKSEWHITTEALDENIAREKLEQQVMEAMMQQISTDLENLAINGNVNLTDDGTPISALLRANDGWDKLTDDAHIVDVEGNYISKRVFAAMLRQMPNQYRNDPTLKWFLSKGVHVDWMDLNADRASATGDESLAGKAPAPFGIPIVEVPLIPDDKDLKVGTATRAYHLGKRTGPFQIRKGVNDILNIEVDNTGPVRVELPQGTFEAFQIAGLINGSDAKLTGVASDDGEGKVFLQSPTTGATSEIDIKDGTVNTTLGFTVGVYVGGAEGGANTVKEGSFIWLSNPKNFVWAIYRGTRVYSKFVQENDRIETVVYNRVDGQIENKNALVKAVNIRVRTF